MPSAGWSEPSPRPSPAARTPAGPTGPERAHSRPGPRLGVSGGLSPVSAPRSGARLHLMSGPTFESRREAEAAMAARRDLGPEYEAQIAAGLAERVEQALWQQHAAGDQRMQIELARLRDDRREGSQRFALTIISL